MKTKLHLIFLLLFFIIKAQSQCDMAETITICDMTQIDYDNDGTFDGIINLYDEYNAIAGVTPIVVGSGTWFDPDYNYALEGATGNLHVWDLSNSTINVSNLYNFQFLDTSAGCTDDIVLTLSLQLGPFSGYAVPTVGANDVNIETCDTGTDLGNCETASKFDLYQAFLSTPSAHGNGIWTYEGSNPNFIEILSNRYLVVDIPYQPGIPLIDEEIFELIYIVPGIDPCSLSTQTTIKVSVVRQVRSGFANSYNLCESEVIAGDFDNINLRDDAYLIGEDIEGVWLVANDPTGQISNPVDDNISLSEVLADLVATTPRFGDATFVYSYFVESRSNVCTDEPSDVLFTIFESIRPFEQEQPLELCERYINTPIINLYDQITFATENGVLYDYPNTGCNDWNFISGPSDLGLITNTVAPPDYPTLCDTFDDPNYSALGNVDLTDATVGTYIFEYLVIPEYNSNRNENFFEFIYDQPDGCTYSFDKSHPCGTYSTQVKIIVHPFNYAGENTSALEFCESEFGSAINLRSLLQTNGTDTIYTGSEAQWTNLDTGLPIGNSFVIPNIDGQETFNFIYHVTANDCLEEATLTFTLYEQSIAGNGGTIAKCFDDSPFNLFDLITGNPDDNGTWSGPGGFTSTNNEVQFNPANYEPGTYTYTTPANGLCDIATSSVAVTVYAEANAGADNFELVCKLDETVNLLDYLDVSATANGTFIDTDATNSLSGSILNLSELTSGDYHFEYQVQPNAICVMVSSMLTITVVDVAIPIAENQTFCLGSDTTIANLEVSNSIDYNWYENETSTETLPLDTSIIQDTTFYVSALDDNGCESNRVKVSANFLPFDASGCESCINDAVSDNDDNINDVLDLCSLPEIFPNFEMKIFNRYGTLVYQADYNTPLFNGSSNVQLSIGTKLPAGVYFYIFNPNDAVFKPFQSDFYLSR